MLIPYGGLPKVELHLHKTLEYRDHLDLPVVDCRTCQRQFVSDEAHEDYVAGPYLESTDYNGRDRSEPRTEAWVQGSG